MDKKTSLQNLKQIVKKYCKIRDWDQFHSPKDLTVGLITEAAELLEHFRFKSESEARDYLNDPRKKRMVEDEVADTLFMLLRFAQMYDIDLSLALKRKIALNRKKYPVYKAKGSNKKYTDL